MLVLAGLSLAALYYLSRSLKLAVCWSIFGAGALVAVFFLSMLYVKEGTDHYTFWTQINFLYFSFVSMIGVLYFIWNNYENMTLPLKISFIASAALLFSTALFIIHTAIPIILYSPVNP